MKRKPEIQGRIRKVLLDETTTWASLLPRRFPCYYIDQIDRLDKDVKLVSLELVDTKVREGILKVYNEHERLYKSYEIETSARNRSPAGYFEFVKRQRDNTPLGEERKRLDHLLAHIIVLTRNWVGINLAERVQYQDLKDGFAILRINSAQKYHRSSKDKLFYPKQCSKGKILRSGCPSKELLSSLVNIYRQELNKQIKSHLKKIQKVAHLMFKKGGEYLGIPVQLPSDSICKQVLSSALFFRNYVQSLSSNGRSTLTLIFEAFYAWTRELYEQAKCETLMKHLLDEMQKPCLCHCITGITFALGTMHAWNRGRSDKLCKFESPDGLFTFDKHLAFCSPLKIHNPLFYQGIDCRREHRYQWDMGGGLIISVMVGSKHRDLEVIDGSMDGNGFSAKNNGFSLPLYEILSTSWSKDLLDDQLRQYLILPPNPPKRLRFRYLLDVNLDPMVLVVSEI